MSRRAASIEPEDGECTPSPSAVQQAHNVARHHAMAPPSVMQTLPPPPPAAPIYSDSKYQVKVCVSLFGSYSPHLSRNVSYMPLFHRLILPTLSFLHVAHVQVREMRSFDLSTGWVCS